MQETLWNKDYIKVWIANFLLNFAFTLIVPLLPLYLWETFAASKDMIGLCLSGYTITTLLFRPFSGYLVDTFPRKVVLVACTFVFASIFVGYLLASTLVVFTVVRTLHGAPFGAATVATSTVAIDVLPSSRRAEGIGYFGLSNNLAMAIGPAIAIYLLNLFNNNFDALFGLSLVIAVITLIVNSSIKLSVRPPVPNKKVMSLDRFFLVKGWKESIAMSCYSFSFGVVATYVAIYGKTELGITTGTGLFFTLFAIGLIISRLTGAPYLKRNLIIRNASIGVVVSLAGYILFAFVSQQWAYYLSALIIGLGNGHMYPAFQNIFLNLAEHSQRGTASSSILTAWDVGVGLGVIFGGIVAEYISYSGAFILGAFINFVGVLYYFTKVRSHFEANKLR